MGVVEDDVPKEPTPSDKGVTEKITGIFKRDRSISSSSSSSSSSDSEDDVEKKKQPDVVVPTDIEETREVEKVIEVEETEKQETPSETPLKEKITGIFKRDQSSSSSSSDSDDEKEDVKPVPHKEEVIRKKTESISSSSSSEDTKVVVEYDVPKEPTPSDKGVNEKITGIFKRDRSISSSSSSSSSSDSEDDVEKKKQPDVVVPTDIEETREVEKVMEVEEKGKQETPSETPIKEKITGIFKRDQSRSLSSSDSDDEKEDIKLISHKEEVLRKKTKSISSST